MIEEAKKNCNDLAKLLIDQGIEVARVGDVNCSQCIKFDETITSQFHLYSPRDMPLTYHDSVYETISPFNNSMNQKVGFECIFNELLKKGAKWYEPKGFR